MGAGAGARQRREGGYGEGARHIFWAWDSDGFASCVLTGSLVVAHRGAHVASGLRERPGREGAGCGEPHINSVADAARRCKGEGRKKLGEGMRGRRRRGRGHMPTSASASQLVRFACVAPGGMTPQATRYEQYKAQQLNGV